MATLIEMTPTEHVAVLASELVALMDPRPGEDALDCTFGAGGHTSALAERIGREGSLTCVDRDPEAAERFVELRPSLEPTARFIPGNFADALERLQADGERFDCVCFDLGISSLQLESPARGFSYASDAPLDMRMDPAQPLSALEVVNEWPQQRLTEVIRGYGDERHAGAIAREIVRRRPIARTAELVEAVRDAVPPSYRFGRGHPAKRTFQAIRIAVNAELEALERALPVAWRLLRVGGRLGAISFHSLEDRRVKRFFADRARECICPPELPVCVCSRTPEGELLTRKAIAPSPEEQEQNPRSRSARLRVAQKLTEERPRPNGGS
jgi:16S rRNA (cytosine1402-N4)-methyltransferase